MLSHRKGKNRHNKDRTSGLKFFLEEITSVLCFRYRFDEQSRPNLTEKNYLDTQKRRCYNFASSLERSKLDTHGTHLHGTAT